MSQAKVDRYKEEKRNREKIMKKQKLEWFLTKTVLSVLALVIIGWVGISVYRNVTETPDDGTVQVETYTVNTSAIDDYLDSLSEN